MQPWIEELREILSNATGPLAGQGGVGSGTQPAGRGGDVIIKVSSFNPDHMEEVLDRLENILDKLDRSTS